MKKDKIEVCLIIPRYENMFSTFYTLEIIKEVSKAVIMQDVNLTIETRWRPPFSSGILFADMMGNEEAVKKARAKNIPYLILNYYKPDSRDNCIGINNERASFEVVKYLAQQGHRRIAFITGKLNAQAGKDRLEGFKRGLKAKKIKLDKRLIVSGDWSKEAGRQAMKKLLALKNPPSAVFAGGDEMALGAMEAARLAGLEIPRDISFVGFDNVPEAEAPKIELTTVQQPFSELTQVGLKSLVQVIKKRPKKPVRILLNSTKLIKRNSVRKI
jgi:DNA-binding LacI/PurR family transcriptional regulator